MSLIEALDEKEAFTRGLLFLYTDSQVRVDYILEIKFIIAFRL